MSGKATPNLHKRSKIESNSKMGDLLPGKGKPRHTKAASVTNYHHSIEAYSSKTKNNAFNQKPTYIILTIDNSGEKGSVRKKETPKSTMQSLTTASYAKQGQSYQQLSSLKKTSKKRATHQRTKSDHIIKSKPSINFKLIKGQIGIDGKHGKSIQMSKNKVGTTKSSFTISPPIAQISHSSGKNI